MTHRTRMPPLPEPDAGSSRRDVLRGIAAVAAGGLAARITPAHGAGFEVNDITLLNPVPVDAVVAPRAPDELASAVRHHRSAISVGGARYSMGGQIAAPTSLHLDMRQYNQVLAIDPVRRIVRVQAGIRWRDLQSAIDPLGLSVKIMQSFANFTVGGALSVNAHGRYVGLGPIINSVRALQLILSGGTIVEASLSQESELFKAAIGGYGGVGVISEVELDLVRNERIERQIEYVTLEDYPTYFRSQILNNPAAILHNADLIFPDLREAVAVTWLKSTKPATIADPLRGPGGSDLEAAGIWALSELPGAQTLRHAVIDPLIYRSQPVVWRNYEASLDVASLGPLAQSNSIFALQEYFVPVARCAAFATALARILSGAAANVLNVSVRHAPADRLATLAWAREDVFSFVLYYKQKTSADAREIVGTWTRQLIDAAIACGGTYYLPYQLHATRNQFERAYPGAADFFALKRRIDPLGQFRNKLWDKYRPA